MTTAKHGALDLPRNLRQKNGSSSPWWIVSGNEDGAGDYLVSRIENPTSKRATVHHEVTVYDDAAPLPAYVRAEVERQYAADQLRRDMLAQGKDTRLFIEERYTASGARTVRVLAIDKQGTDLTNVTGYAATVCGYRKTYPGGRVHISLGGHGYSGAEHVAEALGFYLYGHDFAYSEI